MNENNLLLECSERVVCWLTGESSDKWLGYNSNAVMLGCLSLYQFEIGAGTLIRASHLHLDCLAELPFPPPSWRDRWCVQDQHWDAMSTESLCHRVIVLLLIYRLAGIIQANLSSISWRCRLQPNAERESGCEKYNLTHHWRKLLPAHDMQQWPSIFEFLL